MVGVCISPDTRCRLTKKGSGETPAPISALQGNGESSFVYWESARCDGANKVSMTWNIMSTKTSRSGLCTAWPTRNRASIRQLRYPRPKRGSMGQGKRRIRSETRQGLPSSTVFGDLVEHNATITNYDVSSQKDSKRNNRVGQNQVEGWERRKK